MSYIIAKEILIILSKHQVMMSDKRK